MRNDLNSIVDLVLAATILGYLAIPMCAAEKGAPPVQTWENLKQLHSGQKIEVVELGLKSTRGVFTELYEEAILLRVGQEIVSIPRNRVFRITLLHPAHRRRNILLGVAVGAAAGAALGAAGGANYHEAGETGVFMLVWTPIGAGIGAGVGTILPTGPKTLYRAKNQ
jgi:hypothetical protein